MTKKIIFTLLLTLIASVAWGKKVVTVNVTPTPKIHCQACKDNILKALQFQKGMKDVQFDLEQNIVKLTFDEDVVSLEEISATLQKAGYSIQIAAPAKGLKRPVCHPSEVKQPLRSTAQAPCCKQAATEKAAAAPQKECCKTDGKCAKADGKCAKADGKCAKTDGKCCKKDGKCAKADGKCCKEKATCKADCKCTQPGYDGPKCPAGCQCKAKLQAK